MIQDRAAADRQQRLGRGPGPGAEPRAEPARHDQRRLDGPGRASVEDLADGAVGVDQRQERDGAAQRFQQPLVLVVVPDPAEARRRMHAGARRRVQARAVQHRTPDVAVGDGAQQPVPVVDDDLEQVGGNVDARQHLGQRRVLPAHQRLEFGQPDQSVRLASRISARCQSSMSSTSTDSISGMINARVRGGTKVRWWRRASVRIA